MVHFFYGLVLAAFLALTGCASQGVTGVGEQMTTTYIDGEGRTGIKGLVSLKDDGQPLGEAYVNIYPNAVSNLLGPSQYISSPTDAQGAYTIDVPPGTYYVVARKRLSGQAAGPLSPGDYYSEHQRIVTTVVPGKLSLVNLQVAEVKAPMFFKKSMVDQRTDTGIRGLLLDAQGKPVAGSFAIAYRDPDMKRLPDFVSTLSDPEGKFTIYLPEGGTYYLGARIHAWDMPRPGELYGRLGGDSPTPITVSEGQFVENLKIELAPFTGEYKEGKSRRPFQTPGGN